MADGGIVRDFDKEQYSYMNALFMSQPQDQFIFRRLHDIDNFLNEMIVSGRWIKDFADSTPARYGNYVTKDDNYEITLWGVKYMMQHLADYESHGGLVENAEHEGMLDPYFSLRQYCLQNLPGTSDGEIDSIYFANEYPDQ